MDTGVLIAIIGTAGIVVAALITAISMSRKNHKKVSDRADIQKVNSNDDILLRTFFQGNLSIVLETVLIVVGTSIGAERYDRVLAQLVRRILRSANIEAEIITDHLYLDKIKKFRSNPVISIGSRGTNQLVNMYEEEFELIDRATTGKVLTDGKRPMAFIYGGGVKQTYEAMIGFCENKLVVFIDHWSSLYTQGSKTVEIPSQIDDWLKEIIVTMSD